MTCPALLQFEGKCLKVNFGRYIIGSRLALTQIYIN